MTRTVAVRCVAGLIECLLPRDLSEVVIGDLCEELALRLQSAQRRRAVWWFLLQAARSVPPLLFLSVKRWSWFKSLGVAAVAFVVLDQLEPLVRRWLASNFEPSVNQQIVISLLIGFAACACGGFLATWMRRGSAWIYSVIGASFMIAAIARVESSERLWMLSAFLVIAIAAPIIGGVGYVAVANQWKMRKRK
jgi:hypothetical protein